MKVRGTNPLKNGQIVHRDDAPKMIGGIAYSNQGNKKGKQFRPVFRTSNRNKQNHKNSAAFIDTSQKIQADLEHETIRSGTKKNK